MRPFRAARLMQHLTGGDPYWSSVKALLHFDGTNGSTTLVDEVPAHGGWTCAGAGVLDTSNKEFGSAAFNCNGEGWASHPSNADFTIDVNDFTIEGWKYQTAVGVGYQCIFDNRVGGGPGVAVYESTPSADSLLHVAHNSGFIGNTTGSFTLNQWQHWSVCRQGTDIYASIDGVVELIGTDSRAYMSAPQMIFGEAYVAPGQPQQGLLDECRLTVGIARYTSNFTPPAAAFPNHS